MNIDEFKETYQKFKDVDKITIECNHPLHEPIGELITIGKQPARRNILKNGGDKFICRNCMMKHDNPMNRIGQNRQTDELIMVSCPHPQHEGERERQMKKNCYYGPMKEPL